MRSAALFTVSGLLLVLGLGLFAQAQDGEPPAAEDPTAEDPMAEEPEIEFTPIAELFPLTAVELAAQHGHVSVETIGKSAGGRALEALTVSSRQGGDVQWVALVVAHASGLRDPYESRIAVNLAAWLAQHEEGLPTGTAVRIVPDQSPDATARAAVFPRAGNDTPVDEDGDGEVDEDGPDDIDGDGKVSWMLVPDPGGDVRVSPHEEQEGVFVAARAKPEEGIAPTHRLVPEGRDDDGDGLLNEDGPGGVDISRNFTRSFEEHVPLAGMWPASATETRALIDLLLADQRIAMVYEFGSAESVHAAPGAGDAWPKPSDADKATYDGLRELHGKPEDKESVNKAHAPGKGSMGAAVAHQFGRLYLGRSLAGDPGPAWPHEDAEWPELTLRAVQGGGVAAGTYLADKAPQLRSFPKSGVVRTGEFLLACARGRPRVVFSRTESDGEAGVLRVRTRLANTGRLPTHTERGAELRARRPLNIRVEVPPGGALLAGDPHEQIERIAGGGSSNELSWVVSGPTGATVRITCTGPDTGTVVLERTIP